MEPGTTTRSDAPDAPTPHLHPRAKKLPLSRHSPSPPPSLDIPSSSSPAMLEVSHDYDADASDCDEPHERRRGRTLEVKGTVAAGPSPRSHSPTSLLWGEPGWHAGSFSFASLVAAAAAAVAVTESPTPHASPDQVLEASTSLDDVGHGGEVQSGGDEVKAAKSSSEGVQESSTSSSEAPQAAPDSPTRSKKLTPTAEPFSPRFATSFTPLSPRPNPPRLGINTALSRYAFPAAHAYNDQASVASSPLDPHAPASASAPRRHWSLSSTTSGCSQFDYDGHLLSQGAKYTIADEILQLQSAPLGGAMLYSDDDMEVLADVDEQATNAQRMRAASEDLGPSTGAGHWRLQQSYPSRFASTAGFAHARSASIASSSDSSFFSPTSARPVFERAQTAAQLQTYFEPTGGDSSTAHLPDDCESYPPFSPATPSSGGWSHRGSQASVGGAGTYPPLAHPEPFNLTRDDPLYLEARDLFVESTCTSLETPVTDEHLDTMAQHFDHAMHELHPLAVLFGLSQDAADQLLADPDSSGVNDVVLKVAAMMGRQQQLASTQLSAMGVPLPGPSPNNRKHELYKTEGCRSWDELKWCRYGEKCQFAHGVLEMRYAPRHPKFKSEICRTFWEEGACPYGKRCCFVHTVPDGTTPSSPSTSRKGSTASSRAQSPRPHGRMTSTAVTAAPSRTFGPALSELLGSPSHSSSSSSAQSSPVRARAPILGGGSSSSSSTASSLETSTLFGLGIRERPGQAPATYKDEPQSRLQRLASMSTHGSSSSLASLGGPHGPRGSISSFGSGAPRGSTVSLVSLAAQGYGTSSPIKPAPAPVSSSSSRCFTGAAHARHNSAASFISSGSSAAAPLSPFLARNDSSSSLSSAAASPILRRVGGDWLSGTSHGAMSAEHGKSALDWPEIEELSLDDPPATTGSSFHGRA